MKKLLVSFPRNFSLSVKYSIQWLKNSVTGRQLAVFIIIPAIVLALYFLFISPDRYVSEASIMVKETGAAQLNTGLLEGLGFDAGGVSSDEQLLKAYIISPNLLLLLENELGLKKHFSQSRDFIFGLSSKSSFEDFFLAIHSYNEFFICLRS